MADDDVPDTVTVTGSRIPRERGSAGATSAGGALSGYASPGENRGSSGRRTSPVPWLGAPPLAPPPDMPTVIVTAPAPAPFPWEGPQLPSLDPGGMFHVGDNITGGAPFSLPFHGGASVTPVRPSPPAGAFLLPEPAQLPEVTVSAKRPPVVAPPTSPSLTPAGFAAMLRGLISPWFLLLFPQPANVGENRRVRELIERRIAAGLQPINPSVDRLAEPLPLVTVRSSRLSDRAPSRTPASFFGGALPGPQFRRIGAPFVPSLTAFTRPTPQRLPARRGVQATVGPITQPILGLYEQPLPVPGRRTRVPTPGTTPRVPTIPDVVAPLPSLPLPPRVSPAPVNPPTFGFTPIGAPSTLLQPQLQPARCVCPKPVKTARKRSPRVECWRGTYVETASGLIKSRKEKVPCQ